MKKLFVLILAALMIAACLSAVSMAEAVNAADFTGTWYAEDTGTGYDRADINEDGTITVYPFDVSYEAVTGSWIADANGLTADLGESGTVTLTLQDDVLSLDDGSETVTFTKDAPLAPVAEEFIGTWYGKDPDESAYAVTFNDDFTIKIYPTSDMDESGAKCGTWSLGTRNAVITMEDGTMGTAYEMDGCVTITDPDGENPYDFLNGLDISK